MQVTRSKIIALAIALGYLAAAAVMSGWDAKVVASMCLGLLLPLALIWFPKKMGAAPSRVSFSGIDTETPEIVVTVIGWLWLVGYLPLLAYLQTRR
jgi:hypothetical protein